jgi:hypothetical protein
VWDKIKKAFSIIGGIFSALFFGLMFFFIGRGSSDRRGSTTDDTGNGERTERVTLDTTEIRESRESVERATGHFQSAENILRNAINRSKQKEQETKECNDSNK